MSAPPAPVPGPRFALAPLLRAAGLRAWWGLLVAALVAGFGGSGPGSVGVERGAAGAGAHSPAGIGRATRDTAAAFLAADGASFRIAVRRGEAPARPGLRDPGASDRPPLSHRALPLPAGAVRLPLPHTARPPSRRALAAARDGTLSSASNGVPPPLA